MSNDLFTIQMKAVAINFELRINDIPLFTSRKGRPIVAELPCNHLLFTGFNEVTINIWPTEYENGYPDHAETIFELYQRPIEALRTDRVMIGKVNFPPKLSGERYKKANINEAIKLKINHDMFNPLWYQATPVSWNEDLLSEVTVVYKKYESALQKKDSEKVLELIIEKDKQYANAYYTTLAFQQQQQVDFLNDIFAEKNFVLVPFEKHSIRPVICANTKLVTLLNQDNRSPLQFYNKVTKVTKAIPIYSGKLGKDLKILL